MATSILALLVFVGMILVGILFTPFPSKGIYVSVQVQQPVRSALESAASPVVVTIESARDPGLLPRMYVNSTAVEWDELKRALKDELKLRPTWVVYIDGDPELPWADVAAVADTAKELHAKVVLLTPETGKLVEPEEMLRTRQKR